MKASLLDTNILSLFFRGHPIVTDCFRRYLTEYQTIKLSIISYYEIVSGLRHRDANNQLEKFLTFCSYNTVLPLSEAEVDVAADIYAELRKKGQTVDDIDVLIAGTALANGLVVVTQNRKHFDRIIGLVVDDWSEKSD